MRTLKKNFVKNIKRKKGYRQKEISAINLDNQHICTVSTFGHLMLK